MTDLFDVGDDGGQHRSRRDRRVEAERVSRRRSQRTRSVVAILVSLALVAGAAAVVLPMVRGFFDSDPPPEDYAGPGAGSVMIEIPAGSSGSAIGSILVDADVVASQGAFVAAYNADPNSTSIQAGFYNLQLQMPASDAVTALHDRANRAEISVTVPEGVRAASIYQRISTASGIPLEEVEAAAQDTASYGLPEEAGGNPEGWLGAQTYIVAPTSDATSILRLMVEETVSNLENLNIPREDWQDSLIEASIAQREGMEQDYGQVVRVVINRSDPSNPETVGMLGMDSVNLYGLGLDGVLITQEQKDIDTPYNTFMHAGYPPTPICSPSLAALSATVNPPEGNWNYFVTVDLATGETKFADTYSEFLVYRDEYREWLVANPDYHQTGDTPGMGESGDELEP